MERFRRRNSVSDEYYIGRSDDDSSSSDSTQSDILKQKNSIPRSSDNPGENEDNQVGLDEDKEDNLPTSSNNRTEQEDYRVGLGDEKIIMEQEDYPVGLGDEKEDNMPGGNDSRGEYENNQPGFHEDKEDNMPGGNDSRGEYENNQPGFHEDKVSSPVEIRVKKEHRKLEKRISIPNDKLLLNGYSRKRTRSAHGIRIPLSSDKTLMFQSKLVQEKVREKQFEMFKSLSDLFKGTEQQVLYRVNMLIHQHINLNELKKDSDGFGVLHHAVINQFVTVAEKLIENGAAILEEDKKGNYALHYALGKAAREELREDDVNATTLNTPKGKLNEEEETKKQSCDEMAALIISKMKPFRVRQMFGDETNLDLFEKKEDEDTRLQACDSEDSERASTSSGTPKQLHEKSSVTGGQVEIANIRFRLPKPSERPVHQNAAKTNGFRFIDVVKDKDLKETARTILDKLEDTDPESKSEKPVVYIKLLTEVQTEDPEKTESAFHFIAKNRTELINHPVYRAVVKHKWKKWAFCTYLKNTILYFMGFLALTICTVVGAQSDGVFIYDSPWQYTRLSLEILMCLFILRSLFAEIMQFIIDPRDYVRSLMNWIELSSAILLIEEIGLRFAEMNAHWYLFAVGYVLWTVKGLKYAAITSHTAAYAETLRAVIKRDFWLFAMFFVAIEMVFGGTFLLVLKATDSLDIEPETTTILGIYYVGLRTMIEGGMPIEYTNFPKVAQAVIIAFMSLTIVVMLNILIAQLSNTYETAYAEGKVKSWVTTAEAIVNSEKEAQFKKNLYQKFMCCKCSKNEESKEEDKLPFEKEDLIEEKEKMEEMRSTLKQLDNKLIHADLTIQTIKTRQNVLLHAIQGKNAGDTSHPGRGTSYIAAEDSALHRRIEQIESDLKAILRGIDELKSNKS